MICAAIIECSKRAVDSEQKEKLGEFLEKSSITVLEYCKIEETNEMYKWKGTDWIEKINEKNPVINQDILDYFEDLLGDDFRDYAVEKCYDSWNYIYELCGVYWHVQEESGSDDDFPNSEVNGPSVDEDWIMDFMPRRGN